MTDSDTPSPDSPYDLILTRPAKRALAEDLPTHVAWAATELITGDLAKNPRRVGKELNEPLDGLYSARVMTEWRILYEIDDQAHVITVKAIRHRGTAYSRVPKS